MKTLATTTFIFCSLFFYSLTGHAQSISGVINTYTPVVAINPCDIEVASAAGFAVGDKVMIYQMKGTDINTTNTAAFGQVTAYNDAGNYEWNRIAGIAGTTITLDFQLVNTYDPAGLVQMIRVPEYTNASIDGVLTCAPWNGTTGGVLVFIDYGTTTFNADINVDYNGFQGNALATVGWVNCNATYIEDDATIEAVKGESCTILPTTMTKGLGAPANGGGGSRTDNGGGGGANFGAGGLGGNLGWTALCNVEAQGGWAMTYSNALNKIFLGGAGGDAQDSEGPGICYGESGAGIVIIQTTEIIGNGFNISAEGEDATDTPQDGGGGGGSGGAVLLDCPLYTTALNVNTSGGDGGDAITYPWIACSGGGGGGGGALWVSTPTVDANITYTTLGGVGGLSASTVDGSPGAPGGSIVDLVIPEGTLPLMTVDAGADQTVCDGAFVTLTAFNPDGGVLAWTGGVTDGVPFAPPIGSTMYYVTATLGACSATDSVTVTVNPIPTIDAGLDTLVCEGALVTLTAFNPDGAAIAWSGGITDGVAFPALAGVTTYTVTATLAGCTATDDVDVDGSGAVVVGAGADLTVCEGDLVTLTATNPSGAALAWTGGVTDGVAFTPPVGTTTYTVTGTLGPCSGTDDVDITVVTLPTVGAGADISQCDGGTVTLTAFNPDAGALGWTGGVTDGTPFAPPIGTTTYTVTSTIGACSSTDDVDVTIFPLPVVGAGPDQTVCDGILVTLNGSGAVGYAWTGGITDGAPFSPPLGTTTYTVTGTDANGCTGTDNVDVTANPLDDATFSYPSGLTHCVSGLDPTATITGTGGGNFTFIATSGGPFLDINALTGDITLGTSNTGTYDITYTTTGPCPDALTLSLTITNTPIADFFIDDFCANVGDPVPTFTGGGSAGTFTSTPGLVINPLTGEIDLDASTPGTYTVTNTINVPGCALTVFTEDMTIFDVPTATISGGTTNCPGAVASDLTVDVIGGTGPFTVDYTLDGSAQPPLAIAGASGPITTPGIGTYALTTVTDANGCTATLVDATIVDEYPIPVIDPIADQEVCQNSNLNLTAFTSSLPGDIYSWTNLTGTDVGFGLAGAGNIGSFIGTNGTGGDVTVTVEVTPTSANGCQGLPTTFDVTIHPLPTPSINPDVTQGCAPLTVVFTDGGAGTGTCVWDFGDGSTSSTCGSTSHIYTEEGTYSVSLTTTTIYGCTATANEPGLITVTPVPIAHFTFAPQIITIEDTEVEFTNNSVNATVYNWDFADGSPANSETNPTHTFPEEPGEYIVTLTATNGPNTCFDTFQQLVIIDDVIIFYVPNTFTPDGDEYNEIFKPIITSGVDVYDYHLTIFNRWGEIIFESFNKDFGWNGTYGNQGLVKDGVYVWQIEFGDTNSDKKHKHRGHVTILK